MPARTQENFKPDTGGEEAGGCQDRAVSPFCSFCNASQGTYGCEMVYCDTCEKCNTNCKTCQAYCQVGWEYIKDQPDVGAFTNPGCIEKDEFIFRAWTAPWWNDYQDDLLTADIVGKKESQSANVSFPHGRAETDPQNKGPFPYTNVPFQHPYHSLITGSKYNDLVTALGKFFSSISSVQGAETVGCENATVIRAAHAKALKTGYNAARFKGSVCDICNVVNYQHGGCSCNSSCPCYCGCSCSSD